MEPASTVIEIMGGPTAVAEIVGVHRTRVSKWQSPKHKGGTGGLIPIWHATRLLEKARELDIDLKPDDFFPKLEEAALEADHNEKEAINQ